LLIKQFDERFEWPIIPPPLNGGETDLNQLAWERSASLTSGWRRAELRSLNFKGGWDRGWVRQIL